ncbi:MAG: DUF4442 domain-containing protein [Gemmatimonadota bacterium]|jgi:acyl-coenzyme A thioesterase PaaI-like protein
MERTATATRPQGDSANPTARILALWRRLSGLPAGPALFSFALCRMVRYSGSVRPRVVELEPGRSVVRMRDRARVRNHLRSVHATALVTFGELASGLALITGLPPGLRAIVTGLEVEYKKKARGTLTARGRAPVPDPDQRREYEVTASVVDERGDEVALLRVHWLVGPERAG